MPDAVGAQPRQTCDACTQARRRCVGGAPGGACELCVRRRIACVSTPRRAPGPAKGTPRAPQRRRSAAGAAVDAAAPAAPAAPAAAAAAAVAALPAPLLAPLLAAFARHVQPVFCVLSDGPAIFSPEGFGTLPPLVQCAMLWCVSGGVPDYVPAPPPALTWPAWFWQPLVAGLAAGLSSPATDAVSLMRTVQAACLAYCGSVAWSILRATERWAAGVGVGGHELQALLRDIEAAVLADLDMLMPAAMNLMAALPVDGGAPEWFTPGWRAVWDTVLCLDRADAMDCDRPPVLAVPRALRSDPDTVMAALGRDGPRYWDVFEALALNDAALVRLYWLQMHPTGRTVVLYNLLCRAAGHPDPDPALPVGPSVVLHAVLLHSVVASLPRSPRQQIQTKWLAAAILLGLHSPSSASQAIASAPFRGPPRALPQPLPGLVEEALGSLGPEPGSESDRVCLAAANALSDLHTPDPALAALPETAYITSMVLFAARYRLARVRLAVRTGALEDRLGFGPEAGLAYAARAAGMLGRSNRRKCASLAGSLAGVAAEVRAWRGGMGGWLALEQRAFAGGGEEDGESGSPDEHGVIYGGAASYEVRDVQPCR